MSRHHSPHDSRTACALPECAGTAAWVDSGLAPGLVVVDSNRPAIDASRARRLCMQSGAAHH